MHPLDDIPTIVEHSLDVLRVDGTREVRITIVLAVTARRTYTLEQATNKRRWNEQDRDSRCERVRRKSHEK